MSNLAIEFTAHYNRIPTIDWIVVGRVGVVERCEFKHALNRSARFWIFCCASGSAAALYSICCLEIKETHLVAFGDINIFKGPIVLTDCMRKEILVSLHNRMAERRGRQTAWV